MTKARDLADLLDASGNIIAQGTIDGRDIASDGSKLDGIEAGATGDQTAAEIKTAYESNANTNEFSDAEQSKLAGIETGATGDQTASEIRSLVEAATDSNVFTDADHSKLNGIEAGATADQTKADIDALNVDADTLDGQHGSYYTSYADTAVANIVDSAPGTLDTLNELAAALGDDPNFATTTATNIGTKANKTITVSAGSGLTGGGDLTANRTISHADTSTVSDVNGSGNTFIQDIGFDTYGHVTSVGTGTVTVGDGAMTVTAGSGLSGGGQLGTANQSGASSVTVSHADTSTQASLTALTGANVVSDIDLDTYGHVTNLSTRTMTLANLGYTGATNANNYVHPTHPGDDLSIDTGALSGATVISDLDFNVTTDGLGHVTDANATVATRNLTLANLGYTGATNANYITNNNQLTNGAGYTTNVGDITNVTAGTNLTGGGSSGSVTVNLTASPNITSLNVGGSEVVSSSRALKNIASVDAATVAALTSAGVGAPAAKSWENIGTINYGTRSINTNVSEYWTLPSKYQDGFSGDVMLYGTASRVNQSNNSDTQTSNLWFGDHSFIGTGNGTNLLDWRASINYAWYNGGARDVTDVKFWFSKKLLISSGATFFSSGTGPSGLEINGSGWTGSTDFAGEDSNLQAEERQAVKRTSSNGNAFNLGYIGTQRNSWIPTNDSSWNRRIYSDLKTEQLYWTNFTLTLYINSDL